MVILQTCAQKISAYVDGGLVCADPGARTPIGVCGNYFKFFLNPLNKMSQGCQTTLSPLRWKTTSMTLKLEDNLNIFKIGRRRQYFPKWKTTSKVEYGIWNKGKKKCNCYALTRSIYTQPCLSVCLSVCRSVGLQHILNF